MTSRSIHLSKLRILAMARRGFPEISTKTEVIYVQRTQQRIFLPAGPGVLLSEWYANSKDGSITMPTQIECEAVAIQQYAVASIRKVPMVILKCGYSADHDKLFVSMAQYYDANRDYWR